ncbi:MAG: chemotaxis protein CheC, partial [Proteobacteria bacterium]|nr:chemotaxis protein CheC [Pseudomonadota bacterium]
MQNVAFHDVGEELDRLCELANVGAGHAATALARLIRRPIWMSVPRVRMGTAATGETPLADDDAWIFFEVEGAMGGALVLRLPGSARHLLVEELVGAEAASSHAESALRVARRAGVDSGGGSRRSSARALLIPCAAVDRDRLRALLEGVQRGEVEPSEALDRLAHLPFVDTPHARVDTHRALRSGLPEVVYGPGKTVQQIAEVVHAQRAAGLSVLVTRVDPATADAVLREVPGGEHDVPARLLCYADGEASTRGKGTVLVVSAGTSDLAVAA